MLRGTGATYQPEADTHQWVRFNLRAHYQQARLAWVRLERARRTWDGMATLVKRLGLPERMATALHTAAVGPLRPEMYEQDEGLTREQAAYDLQQLERTDLLDSHGYGARLYHTVAGRAKDVDDTVLNALRSPVLEPYKRDRASFVDARSPGM